MILEVSNCPLAFPAKRCYMCIYNIYVLINSENGPGSLPVVSARDEHWRETLCPQAVRSREALLTLPWAFLALPGSTGWLSCPVSMKS